MIIRRESSHCIPWLVIGGRFPIFKPKSHTLAVGRPRRHWHAHSCPSQILEAVATTLVLWDRDWATAVAGSNFRTGCDRCLLPWVRIHQTSSRWTNDEQEVPPFPDNVTDYNANQEHRLGADPALKRLNGIDRRVKLMLVSLPQAQIFMKYHKHFKL